MRPFLIAMIGAASLLAATTVQAQDDRRDQRRQFVEGILRTLAETQLGNQPTPQPQARPQASDPRLREVQALLDGFSEECDHLVVELRDEERLTPALRPILADLLRVKANCDVLRQRAHLYNVPQLASQFVQIDRDWRNVSHRLRQIYGLNQDLLSHIHQLNAYDSRLCDLLGVVPQLDRTEVVRLAAAIEQDLNHLMDDLAIDFRLRPDPKDVLGEGRRLIAHIRTVGALAASNASNAAIITQYRDFHQRWRRLVIEIRSSSDSHVERVVRSIAKSNNELHDVLWLKKELDRDELLALARALSHNLRQLGQTITLTVMLELPDPQIVVADAQHLFVSCDQLIQSVSGTDPVADLIWDFRIVEVEWQQVLQHFQSSKAPEVHRQLSMVSQTMSQLRESLGEDLAVDHRTAIALAAAVDDFADSLHHEVERYIAANRLPIQVRGQVLQAAESLRQAARQMHRSVADHAPESALRTQCIQLAQAFSAMTQTIDRLEGPPRDSLQQACNRARPDVAKLQLLYTY